MKKILVAVDPLRESDPVMMAAIAYAKMMGASLKVVTVNLRNESSDTKALRRMGLESIADLCRGKGVRAAFQMEEVEGGTDALAAAIGRMALGYDLMVMGHMQYEGLDKFFRQSTAQDVSNVSRTPLLLVPQPGGKSVEAPVLVGGRTA